MFVCMCDVRSARMHMWLDGLMDGIVHLCNHVCGFTYVYYVPMERCTCDTDDSANMNGHMYG